MVCIEMSNSHINVEAHAREWSPFMLILVKLISLVLNWRHGTCFTLSAIKHSLNDALL